MSRIIVIDEDTSVGYNFSNKYFFVWNKNTYTHRYTAPEIKAVLDIVAPDNTVTLEQIQAKKDTPEALTNLYYTWSDEGDYIQTVQLNDYSQHPISLKLDSDKLYIMNSELIFDLTLNEDINYRTDYITSYFEKYIGLGEIVIDNGVEINKFRLQIKALYQYLMSFYEPTVYNQIEPDSILRAKGDSDMSALRYNNVYSISNYNSTSPAQYICTLNPDKQYTPNQIGSIAVMQTETNDIALTGAVPEDLTEGSTILVADSTVDVSGVLYTNDGKYTVKSIDTENSIITTEEAIPCDYVFPYIYAYKVVGRAALNQISRDNSTISTITNLPADLTVGDVIEVYGTSFTSDGETKTLDDSYTITGFIDTKTFSVAEVPKYNYTNPDTSTTGAFANGQYIYKRVYLSPIISMVNHSTYTTCETLQPLTDTSSYTIAVGDFVDFVQNGKSISAPSASGITRINSSYTEFDVSNPYLLSYVPDYPKLQKEQDNPTVQIQITDTSEVYTFPICTFKVDNFNQSVQYLSTLNHLKVPTADIENHIGTALSSSIVIPGLESIPAYSLGVYSMVYTEQNK